jgi:thiamine pyrophosphate-dependent acetolactate synthase large subunit-like protein
MTSELTGEVATTEMTSGTGGDAVVAALSHSGVNTVFGIPGGHNIDLFDALARSDSIRTVQPRHEQGAGFMADGYARTKRATGVIACLEGPGMGNAMTALGEAFQDSSPVLVISSQIPTEFDGRDIGLIHELPNHLETFRAVTVASHRATSVSQIPDIITQGLSRHGSGHRPGPVHVEIPLDILEQRGDWELATGQANDTHPIARELDAAAEILAHGAKPVIFAGGGASRGGAEREVLRLAEHLGAPVITTALGKGAIPESHELYVGTSSLWSPWLASGPVSDLIAAADPLLVVGSRLTDASTTNWTMPQPESMLRIDVDPDVPLHHYRIDMTVTGEASTVLQRLTELVPSRNGGPPSHIIEAARRSILDHARAGMGDGLQMLETVSAILGPETVLTGDSLIGLWAATAWHTDAPRRYHVPMHFNTLGFALPGAIGAHLAAPGAPTVAIAGDGAFLFTAAELSTAVQEDIPVVVIVCNDHGYESIRRQQQARFDGRTIAVDIESPDFVAFARAMGAEGHLARDISELESALERSVSSGRPSLIEIPLSVAPPWES